MSSSRCQDGGREDRSREARGWDDPGELIGEVCGEQWRHRERGVKEFEFQVRTMKSALDERIGTNVRSDSNIFPWMTNSRQCC